MHEKVLPSIVCVRGDTVVVREPDGGERTLQRHEMVGCWTLMAVVKLPEHGEAAVFEDLQDAEGAILFATPAGELLHLNKSLVPTRVREESCYGGHAKHEVVGAGHDILRDELLARPDDPFPDEVAALFPPIRRVTLGGLEAPHTFVGSRSCDDVIPIYYDPSRAIPRVNPLVLAPEIQDALDNEELWEGLVGGWLPAVRIVYPCADCDWDTTTFAVAESSSKRIQPAWYRFLRLENGRVTRAHYIESYLPYPWPDEPPPAEFYRALYDLHISWTTELTDAMEVEVPEAWIGDFCRHAMVQEMITRAGDHPHYGVLDRVYGAPEHDGFQDILNSAVSCYLEWGLFDVARRYLDNYLNEFVRTDGSIDYRGPEIGQYARTLTLLVQYAEYTGDTAFLVRHDVKIRAIVDILATRRKEATLRDLDDPSYGLLSGRHEADISFDTPSLAFYDYEQPYFSNSTEGWRAFHDLGRVWRHASDSDTATRGETLMTEASALAAHILRAIDASWIVRSGIRTLPLIAGSKRLHFDAPYRSRPESFDENRVWSEMLHSGLLPQPVVEALLESASAHGDTTLGIFGNRKLTVAFTVYGLAYGLIQHDLVREFLLFYYAHAFHLHTRGTWTALECVDLDRGRAEHLPYCAPAQMTIPTVTRWMLAFDDPITDELWLAKATPRSWLEDGKRISIGHAPTRWGSLSYVIESRLRDYVVSGNIELPEQYTTHAMLRLRLPRPHVIAAVDLNGRPWVDFDADRETISLPADRPRPLKLTVYLR